MSDLLQATRETKPENVPYFALGTIEYVSDARIDGKVPRGHILYIKPTVRGDEWAADIIAYQRANPDFPHQATGDEWFDEPQLEAGTHSSALELGERWAPGCAGPFWRVGQA